jgi:D-alanyl-D-alanine carboxypeptidase/D-alanyl-D-alanine-endopeptidase (penicillin-binding protein 4)
MRLARIAIIAPILFASLACAQTPPPITDAPFPTAGPLATQITTLLADPAVSRAHWGIAVTTLNGTPIYGLDEAKLFRPASTAKLFTTAAAMALLGPDSTVDTTADFPKPSPDGTVTGDLTLVGRDDANLSGRIIPYAHAEPSAQQHPDPLRYIDDFAAKTATAGVKHITGDIIGSSWPWEPYPQGWGTDDLLWGYGAPVASLSLDDNQVLLTITPGTLDEPEQSITLTPDVGYYTLAKSFVRTHDAKSSSNIAIYRDPGSRTLRIVGTVPAGHPYETELAIEDPPLYAAYALLSKLREHGITVDGTATSPHDADFVGNPDDFLRESTMSLNLNPEIHTLNGAGGPSPDFILLRHTSPTLAEDISVTLKESQNLHAELMLRRLSRKFPLDSPLTASTFAQGARVVRQYLLNAGLDPADFIFYDGSGLSVKDLVTPRATAQLLAYAAKQPWFAQWKAALPIGGVDGTLEHRFTTALLKGHVFAKTGTLGESRALSGYLDAASGRTLIFSILIDNHLPGTSADRSTMDKIVAAIAAAN